MKRSEIENKYKWKLEDMVSSDDKWEKLFAAVQARIGDFAKYNSKLGDRDSCLECLKLLTSVFRDLERVIVYSNMRMHEDGSVAKYAGYASRADSLEPNVSAAVSFISSELGALDSAVIKSYIDDKAFSDYDYMLQEVLRTKEHILSAPEEKLLALAGDALNGYKNVFEMLNNVDIKFPDIEVDGKKYPLTHATYGEYLYSDNRALREKTMSTIHNEFGNKINMLAANYAGNVKSNNFIARARKHDDCLAMSMYGDDVPVSVYENLLSGIDRNIKTMHDYIALRKNILGYDELHCYDMHVSLGDNPFKDVPYEEACKNVVEGLKPMGKEYVGYLNEAFNNGWIDVFENEGKRSGAYSWSCYDSKHSYVLLNYTPNVRETFVIAHELGHAVHFHLSAKNQPYDKWGHQIFVAEVASTTNETLLFKHMLSKASTAEEKKFLLTYFLDSFRMTVFRQTQFAEFEYDAHKADLDGKPLTADALCEMYYNLNKKYYGDAMIHDDFIKYEWARIPHFYTAFYVYKYATGLISAINIADKILNEKGYAKKYMDNFLSAGGKKSPYKILCDAGVDLATPEPYDRAFKVFNDTLAEYKELTKK